MTDPARPAESVTHPSAELFVPALVALLVGALAMGASPIFVRLADVGPFASAFWRVALALPALWAWDRYEARREQRTPPLGNRPRRAWSMPVILAGVLFAGDLSFWHLAITHTTVANATFFATTAPVWVVLGSWAMRSEAVGRATLVGLFLALAGGATLLGESVSVEPGRVMGDVFGLITAIFFGAYFLAVRAARKWHGPARITYASSLLTALLLLGVATASGERLLPASAEGLAMLVALALVSHAGGQGLLAFSLGYLPATFSSLVIFVEAIGAAALGWIALGEALSPLQVAGGLVILAGIWIARPRTARNAPTISDAAQILPLSAAMSGDEGDERSQENAGTAAWRGGRPD